MKKIVDKENSKIIFRNIKTYIQPEENFDVELETIIKWQYVDSTTGQIVEESCNESFPTKAISYTAYNTVTKQEIWGEMSNFGLSKNCGQLYYPADLKYSKNPDLKVWNIAQPYYLIDTNYDDSDPRKRVITYTLQRERTLMDLEVKVNWYTHYSENNYDELEDCSEFTTTIVYSDIISNDPSKKTCKQLLIVAS